MDPSCAYFGVFLALYHFLGCSLRVQSSREILVQQLLPKLVFFSLPFFSFFFSSLFPFLLFLFFLKIL